VLVETFPSAVFGTNCYVLATGPGEQCLVLDPGIGILDDLDELLRRHRLSPAAVVLTHGHVDHTFSVAPVCGARGITAYIHPADADLLAHPERALSAQMTELFGGRLRMTEPDDVAPLTDGGTLRIAGIDLTVDHAPGHTGGSVLLRTQSEQAPLCFSGDVLFAGSIGRTDLPGGDGAAMSASLRDRILPLADETVVLPGHGPSTTIGRERRSNPYLQNLPPPGADPAAQRPAAPTRGW
jgi:hydroxyacylglutathione hydrolase